MSLTVKYFASLREAIGLEEEIFEPVVGVKTAADLRTFLCERGEPYATALAAGRSVRVAINFDMVEPTAVLPASGEVAFFPPVTGG